MKSESESASNARLAARIRELADRMRARSPAAPKPAPKSLDPLPPRAPRDAVDILREYLDSTKRP